MQRIFILLGLIAPLFFFVVLPPTAVQAQSNSHLTTFAVAAQLYANGRYSEAAQAYEQLIAQGWHDAAIYYNLGNAYYQQGDKGLAILNYERAARLAPRDADIRANLQVARSQIVNPLTADPTPLAQLTTFARSWLTLNEMATIALLLWFLLAGGWLLYRRWQTAWMKGFVAVTAVLMLVTVFSLSIWLREEFVRPIAIIVAAETAVTSSPDDQAPVEFTLPSGTAVHILEQRRQWTHIALPGNHLQGWLAVDSVTAVTP